MMHHTTDRYITNYCTSSRSSRSCIFAVTGCCAGAAYITQTANPAHMCTRAEPYRFHSAKIIYIMQIIFSKPGICFPRKIYIMEWGSDLI